MNAVDIADALAEYGTATVYEAAGKFGDLSAFIRPIVPGVRLGGIARTLRVWPGDTLGVLRAIDAAQRGDVIVVDAGGTGLGAVWGGTSSLACQARGVRGCVTNGLVRDVDDFIALRFPVFAAGVSPRGTQKNHPGWHGIPVTIGEAVINTGDIVIGDSDGVLVVRQAEAAGVLEKAKEQDRKQRERDARARSGESLCAILGFPPS